MGFTNYEVQFQLAVEFFQSGKFEESLRGFQDLLVYENQLTTEQHFDLLNYVTNCQVNLNEVERAFEHLVVLQSLAEKINSAEALYYTEMKRGIVAFKLGDNATFEEAFERVFHYARETGKMKHLCDATGNYLYFLIEQKRFEEARAIFEKNIPAFDEILQHSPVSIRSIFPHAVKVYFYCDQLEPILNLVSFIEIHKEHPIVQTFSYIYSEMLMYVALLREDMDQLLESTDRLETYYASKEYHQEIQQMYKELINVCEERRMLEEAIMFAQKLVLYYKSQGVSKESVDATIDMKKAALTDNLTKLYNRRFFEHFDAPEELTVVFIDIDNFKSINDTYGHRVGDDVLRQIGQIIQSLLTNQMIGIRYGGDEFVILIQESPTIAKQLTLELYEAINPLFLTSFDSQLLIHLSVGFCYRQKGESVTQLLARADSAQYEAKFNMHQSIVEGLSYDSTTN